MEEFAECLEKMLEMAEGSIGHAAEATATFLKLNHGSSPCILGVISRLDQMMTSKRQMVSEERFTPLFQMLADDFVRSALTKVWCFCHVTRHNAHHESSLAWESNRFFTPNAAG
jgi:hypothetical protein